MQRSLYKLSGSFKGLLFVMAVVIILVLLVYSQKLVQQLREESREILLFYAQMYARVASEESNEDLSFIFEQIIKRTNFPIINASKEGEPIYWKGIGIDEMDRSPKAVEKARKIMRRMERVAKPIPLVYQGNILGYLYYGDSATIQQLRWLPYIEIGVVGLFILVAFIGFSSIKRSEQRFIWVGMAKETAHQLGTPLSSLMGWLEIVKEEIYGRKKLTRIVTEMSRDVERLYKVAARFSQIGSRADLKEQEVAPLLAEVANYFRRRLPHMGKKIEIKEHYQEVPKVALNKELFEWSVENLIKNSLDAIEKDEGVIEITLAPLSDYQAGKIFIDIKDNGKGIEFKNKRDIFKPGYSTKKRGWGLGLNLAKRIIEEYHGGKLLLKESRIGVGTTMRIILASINSV